MNTAMHANYFSNYFFTNKGKGCHKLLHYFDIYQNHLAHLQGKTVRFLEIGVFRGGSVAMWQGFFSPESSLIFADIDPECAKHAQGNAVVEIGDQSDPAFLRKLIEKYGPFDVIVDDGGHTMQQQTTSFECLWPALKNPGVYLVEDTHTSYWERFGGGYAKSNSFVEYSKRLVDVMHAWYSYDPKTLSPTAMTRELDSVSFHDSIIVFKKTYRSIPEYKISAWGDIIVAPGFRESLQINDAVRDK